MKNTAIALTFATLLLAGTPVLAENPVEPGAPGSDKSPGVTPNDAKAAPTDATKTNDATKQTGASNPDTPDPTKNTPGGAGLAFSLLFVGPANQTNTALALYRNEPWLGRPCSGTVPLRS
jgi:hypothetical protein